MKFIGRNINAIIVFVSVIVVIFGLFFIKSGLTKEKESSNIIYSATINKNVDYKVNLYNNNYYDKLELSKGLSYPVKGIKTIPFDIKYKYSGNKDSKINYTYNITLDVVGNVSSDKSTSQIWNKSYVLKEQQPITTINGKDFDINDSVVLNYQYFNTLKTNYENTYGFSLNSYISIKMNVTYSLVLPNSKESEENKDVVEIVIPLNENVTKVEERFQPSTIKDVVITKEINKDSNFKLYIGILLVILSLLAILLCYKRQEVSEEKKYYRNINKILKEYADLVVTVSNKPTLTGLRQLKLVNLDDLIDVAEQNSSNIIHYEVVKNKSSILYVITNGYVYSFEVTSEEI